MKKHYTIIFLFFASIHFLAAQDGTLDTSFGTNGITVVDNGTNNAEIISIIKTLDNKILGAGFVEQSGTETIAVVRFESNGTLDNSFGTNGVLTIPQGTEDGRATTIVEQIDGKILVGGWARFSNKDQYVLARLMADGTMDTTFGTDGIVTGNFSGSSYGEDEMAEMLLMSDGKIVVAGRSYGGLNDDVFVGVFNPDGSRFTDFGTNGFSIIQWNQDSPSEAATAMVLDAQDNIYLGGRVKVGGFFDEDSFFLTKLNNLGVMDMTFGDQGKVFHTLSADVKAGLNVIRLDADGRIVTGGGAFDTDQLDNNFFLTRYLPDGQIDNSFGTDGMVIIPRSSNESIWDLKTLASGDIIAAGSTGGFASRFALVRFNSSGEQDLTFGDNGWATTSIESDFNSIQSIVVDETSILAGGDGYDGTTYKMILAKYKNENTSNVQNLKISKLNFDIFPNPTAAEFSVTIDLQNEAQLNIQLTNVSGQLISELLPNQKTGKGSSKFDFTLPSGLAKGSYFVTLNLENEVVSKMIQVN